MSAPSTGEAWHSHDHRDRAAPYLVVLEVLVCGTVRCRRYADAACTLARGVAFVAPGAMRPPLYIRQDGTLG